VEFLIEIMVDGGTALLVGVCDAREPPLLLSTGRQIASEEVGLVAD
jgi:hypothetical protein